MRETNAAFEGSISGDERPRFDRGAAADGHDAARSGGAHPGNHGADEVESGPQVQVEHALERPVASCGHRLAAGEAAYEVHQNIDALEASGNRVGEGAGGFAAREFGRHGGETRMREVRRPDRS